MAGHSRDQMIVAWLLKHEMHVRGPPGVALELQQQLADGPVVGDRVADGDDGLEPEEAVGVARHDAAAVGPGVVGVLHIVVARRVRLPDVDLAAGDRLPRRVAQRAHHQARLARRVGRDGAAVGQVERLVRVEGPEHRALGALARFRVVDRVDEQREAEDVGQEDEFLADIVAHLSRRGEELQASHPFFRAETRLACKVVQMRYQSLEDEFEARVGVVGVDHDRICSDVVGVHVFHWGNLDLGWIHIGKYRFGS